MSERLHQLQLETIQKDPSFVRLQYLAYRLRDEFWKGDPNLKPALVTRSQDWTTDVRLLVHGDQPVSEGVALSLTRNRPLGVKFTEQKANRWLLVTDALSSPEAQLYYQKIPQEELEQLARRVTGTEIPLDVLLEIGLKIATPIPQDRNQISLKSA